MDEIEVPQEKLRAAEAAISQIPLEEKSWRLQPQPAGRSTDIAPDLTRSLQARSKSDLTDVQLKRRASPLAEAFQGRLPLPSELHDINAHFGLEIAQTVFTESVERSPVYGPFLRRVRSYDLREANSHRESASAFEVTLVPSALPEAEWGAFVEPIRAWARSLGFTTDVVATREDHDIRENARVLSSYLLSNPHPRRILVTFGQGAAEFRSLLAQRMGLRGVTSGEDAHELSTIHTWLNVTGAFGGASSARRVNESRWKSFLTEASRYFGGGDRRLRAQRSRQLDSRLPVYRNLPNLPRDLQVINVVGLCTRADVPLKLAVSHLEIASSLGPNDGLTTVFEQIAHPGLIVPVPGLSAFGPQFRLEPIVKRLLAIVAEDAAL